MKTEMTTKTKAMMRIIIINNTCCILILYLLLNFRQYHVSMEMKTVDNFSIPFCLSNNYTVKQQNASINHRYKFIEHGNDPGFASLNFRVFIIQGLVKWHLWLYLSSKLCQNYAHTMTAQLSWYVHNLDMITLNKCAILQKKNGENWWWCTVN